MAGVDIELLFGVLGGGSVGGASGSRIHSELQAIVNGINDLKVKVALDPSSRTAIQKEIESAVKTSSKNASSALSSQLAASSRSVTSSGGKATSTTNASKVTADVTRLTAQYDKLNASLTRYQALQSARASRDQSAEFRNMSTAIEEFDAMLQMIKTDLANGDVASAKFGMSLANNIQRQVTQAASALKASDAEMARTEKATDRAAAAFARLAVQVQEYKKNIQGTASKSTLGRLDSMADLYSQYGRGDFGNALKGLNSSQIDEFVNKARTGFVQFQDAVNRAGEATATFGQRLVQTFQNRVSYALSARIYMAVEQSMRQLVSSAMEVESSMAQLQIVTGASDAQMQKFSETAFTLAKNLGQSASGILSSIETFSRLGYDLTSASKLAEVTGILSNVAAVGSEEATTGLTSIIKGFDMDVSQADHVADVLVDVGQKYAVSAGEMMTAYEKSSAALNATNTSFEKSAGLIAAANAAVQDAGVVGKLLPSATVMCA